MNGCLAGPHLSTFTCILRTLDLRLEAIICCKVVQRLLAAINTIFHCTPLHSLDNMPAVRGADSKKKTRRHTRDLDQIHADLHSEKHLDQHKNSKVPEDLPGLGQWYCTECAKWFESELNYTAHGKQKPHKRRFVSLAQI